MNFVKMHGCGNDFILVDCFEDRLENPAALAPQLCHRHFGIGADGLLTYEASDSADAMMRTYNADGSEAEMCGNGVRCLAALLLSTGRIAPPRVTIETPGGTKTVTRLSLPSGITVYEVDMGVPIFSLHEEEGDSGAATAASQGKAAPKPLTVELAGVKMEGFPVSMGNPHFVVFVDDLDSFPVGKFGAALERAAPFPCGTNVEFVQPMDGRTLAQRTWERGVGETLACGTGACAAAATVMGLGKAKNPVTIRLEGGELLIERRESGSLVMSGEVAEIYRGTLPDR